MSLRAVADSGTTGAVRIVLDGDQTSAEFAVTGDDAGNEAPHTVQVPAGQLAMQAHRRRRGPGPGSPAALIATSWFIRFVPPRPLNHPGRSGDFPPPAETRRFRPLDLSCSS